LSQPSIIAIDGAAASGKSTIGSILARRLGYTYFDTGVMYRAVTWAALAYGIPIEDEAGVTRLAERLHIRVESPTRTDGRQYTVYADGQDVTWAIRQAEVDAAVSPVSAYPGVRRALTEQQRRIAAGGRMVMVGRDIGTVVLPDADLKLFIQASVEERARRRYRESRSRGEQVSYEEVLKSMRRRDEIDSRRAHAPLRAAEDAIVIDTDGLDVAAVVARIELLLHNHTPEGKEAKCDASY
jgi:cytidylate kinase